MVCNVQWRRNCCGWCSQIEVYCEEFWTQDHFQEKKNLFAIEFSKANWMEENFDDLFSRLARVRNFTYAINVNEEAVFDHTFMVDDFAL
jgi:hypothetical protein